MVGMVVRYDERVNGADIPAVESEPLLGAGSAYTGVEKELPSACLDVNAVPVASGLERYHLHGRTDVRKTLLFSGQEGRFTKLSSRPRWHREIVRCAD